MTDFIASLSSGVLYPALFVGLVLVGGLVLVPAIYLTLIGVVKLTSLFLITVFAAIFSDSFWYLIGRHTKKEKLYSWKFITKRIEEAKRFSAFFSKHGALLVFMTKFVYGTRIASHILAGMHKIRFSTFVLAISSGTAIWFWIFYFLIKSLDMGIEATKATAFRVQIIFLVALTTLLLLNLLTGKYLRKRLLKSGKK